MIIIIIADNNLRGYSVASRLSGRVGYLCRNYKWLQTLSGLTQWKFPAGSVYLSIGIIGKPLLHIDSQDPGWQRDLCPHSISSRAKGMWQVAQHLVNLLPRSDISVLVTFHWPKQVTWSYLTLHWQGTILSCTWKEEREKYLGSSTNDYTRHRVKFLTPVVSILTMPWWRNCMRPIFLIIWEAKVSHFVNCVWNRMWDQMCWIPVSVLIPRKLSCFFKMSDYTFVELTNYQGTKFKCFIHFI